ncbi:MAG: hypothetical protein J6S18_00365, partial [Oscillospiraceae bacterium]|nr:hypothetical protein [Oscillospiraceae bacterium]
MKRTLSLILAVLMVVALFAGCGKDTTTPTTPAPDTPASSAPSTGTETPDTPETPEAPVEEDSPYNFAKGKFKADEKGLALEKYEYELPLTTTDEVFTMWTTSFTPDYLPEGGYQEMEFPRAVYELTGVNMEYVMITSDKRQENFSVLLAADDLCDIMVGANSFYPGNFKLGVTEEEFFVNLYDYREYTPNYIYETLRYPDDIDTIKKVFNEDELILCFYELKEVLELNSGAFARGDWLEKMGKKNTDIKTFDDIYEMLKFFKTEIGCETPMTIMNNIELPGAYEFVGYDTYAACSGISTHYVTDGKVYLSNTRDNDRQLMTMLNKWYTEGLIDPNWSGYASLPDYDAKLDTGEMGYTSCVRPTAMASHNIYLPEGYGWEAIPKPVLTEGQTLHMGFNIDRIYWGSAAVAAKCENIPLVCTWIDYRYSEGGKELYAYGLEDVSWYWDENGERRITDYILQHPAYWSMIMLSYALNSIAEPGLYVNYNWLIPENAVAQKYLEDWDTVPHDNAYVYPTGISFTNEQSEDLATYGSDLGTYISENYLAFIDGSKPLSEWDSYAAELYNIGLNEVLAVYQEAYDAYVA